MRSGTLVVQFPPSIGHIKASARAEVVQSRLARAMGMSTHVIVAESYGHMAATLERSEVDLAWAPAALFERFQKSVRFALRSSRLSGQTQRSALVARADSNISPLMLRGKRASWVDPQSTSGYLMVRSWLVQQGIDPDKVLAEQTFSGSFSASVENVLRRRSDITSIFVHGRTMFDFKQSLSEIHGGAGDELEPIGYTDPLPSDGLLITHSLERETACQLSLLLADPSDPTCLRAACNVEDFVAV